MYDANKPDKQTEKIIFINFRIMDKWIMIKGKSVNNFCIQISSFAVFIFKCILLVVGRT